MGNEALRFARKNLRQIRITDGGWVTEYEDPATGEKWIMDRPNGSAQGGGSPRLRKVS